MLAAITAAKDVFDNIYYVNTRFPNNTIAVDKNARIHFVQPSKLQSTVGFFIAFFSLFKPVVFKDMIKCIRDKKKIFHVVKLFFIEQSVHHRIFPRAKKIIEHNEKNSEVVVLSTWFDACAYSAATLKRAFPKVKAVSLAHSYEILTIRNPYVPYRHINYKHQYLDGVFFISHIIREMYFSGVGQLPTHYIDKTHVCYLGTYKDNDKLNPFEKSSFNICTCSRVVSLKRLDVLMDALREWDNGNINWTHIGDGPLLDSYKQVAMDVMENNVKVHIDFVGRIPNDAVKAYYASHPIDIFLNLSDIEGLPISIMEAISYGIPVIATNVGGTSEIVNPKTGYLIEPDITPSIVREYLWKYEKMPLEEKKQLRKDAFEYWKTNFDAKTNLKILFDQIDNLATSK